MPPLVTVRWLRYSPVAPSGAPATRRRIVWPWPVAPYQVHLLNLDPGNVEVMELSNRLEKELEEAGRDLRGDLVRRREDRRVGVAHLVDDLAVGEEDHVKPAVEAEGSVTISCPAASTTAPRACVS